MHRYFLPLGLTLALLGSSCGKEANATLENAKTAVTDLANPEAITKKATAFFDSMKSSFADIKDVEGAKAAVTKLMPDVDMLAKAKEALGDKFPSMSSFSGIVDSIKTQFAGNDGIMGVLKPLLDKLKSFMG